MAFHGLLALLATLQLGASAGYAPASHAATAAKAPTSAKAARADPDAMWLRYERTAASPSIASVHVKADKAVLAQRSSTAQLSAVADELGSALTKMFGNNVPTACCGDFGKEASASSLTVLVSNSEFDHLLGPEGFEIVHTTAAPPAIGTTSIHASTPSGALYGTFRLLAHLQAGKPLNELLSEPSTPAMAMRMWDLWDDLDGGITRGYAGQSLVWPMALWSPGPGPEARKAFIAPCNSSDLRQLWTGEEVFGSGNANGPLKNAANGLCLSNAPTVMSSVASACGSADSLFSYNKSSLQIVDLADGVCMDVPWKSWVSAYRCHPLTDHTDLSHQQFRYESVAGQGQGLIRSDAWPGHCVALLNAQPPDHPPQPDPASSFIARFEGMLRLLKSVGINSLVLNNVNACGQNSPLLASDVLANVTRNLRPSLERFAITPFFSACFAAPTVLSNVTADPADPASQAWWADKVDEVYKLLPSFGGFLVKADSEGNVGPATFNRTEAEGANLLAKALKPHGGRVVWRAFVYGNACTQLPGDPPSKCNNPEIGREDIERQAYDTFHPLDGHFDDNVILQIKSGPMDFQIREPLCPLFGAFVKTPVIMEVQAAHEYTGQAIHAVNLGTMWKEYLDFDMRNGGSNASSDSNLVRDIVSHGGSGWRPANSTQAFVGGMAAVSNLGDDSNWTGHVLSGSNTYSFGRLSWDPTLSAEDINREWAALTFPSGSPSAIDTVTSILQKSRDVYEAYTSPLGIAEISQFGTVVPGSGGCAPITAGPGKGPGGAICPPYPLGPPTSSSSQLGDVVGTSHYWMAPCENYGSQNCTRHGLGCDRTANPGGSATGFAGLYSKPLSDLYSNVETCPTNLLLWFHHLTWDHPIPSTSGSDTSKPLWQYIEDGHDAGVKAAKQLSTDWDSLQGLIDDARFEGVQARFAQQLNDAAVFRDTVINYYAFLRGGKRGKKEASTTSPTCVADGKPSWNGPKTYLFLKPCDASDKTQVWSGSALQSTDVAGAITNRGAGNQCLTTTSAAPAKVDSGCSATFIYNTSNLTVSVVMPAPGTTRGKGAGACLDVDGGIGPKVELWSCHAASSPDAKHQQFVFDAKLGQLKHNTGSEELCLSLNRTIEYPYILTPCVYPNGAAAVHPPMPQSTVLKGIEVVNDSISIPGYGADTFYPTEDRRGNLYSGFDDGGVGVGDGKVGVNSARPTFTTGSAVVTGDDWRSLSVRAVGGAQFEDGSPVDGRYTSANTFINGTWWIGSYGGSYGDKACSMGTGVPQLCQMSPFVGFRHSKDGGKTWAEPSNPRTGSILNVTHGLFGERLGAGIKFGAPHVVDCGPENSLCPFNTGGGKSLFVVAMGCDSLTASSNCSWISGDAVYLAKIQDFSAKDPDSLNDPSAWSFWQGSSAKGSSSAATWTSQVSQARPILSWPGRVGTVTSTWHPGFQRYLLAVTTPTTMPSTVGSYDTWVAETADLTTGPAGFSLVTYMRRFGQQAYFVSFPSRFLGSRSGSNSSSSNLRGAVMTFSANFACITDGCTPNIRGAGYGANLLNVQFK